LSWGASDQERRLQGVVRLGTVVEVDPAAARARVSLGGEAVSGWVPFTAIRAGGLNAWAPVTVGEQVVMVSPGGDTAQGVIIGSLPSGGNAAPSRDGGAFRFEIGATSITLTGGSLVLESNGASISIGAGGVAVTGPGLTHNGANVGDSHTHAHGDPAGTTSPPG